MTQPRSLWLLTVLIAVVFWWMLFSPTPKVLVWPDSIGYLRPALDALEHGQFTHANGRGSGYALLLWAGLSLRAEPMVIVTTQRLLAFATLLAVFLAIRPLVVRSSAVRATVPVAALWLLVVPMYPPVSGLVYAVMPETLFAFLLAVLAACVVALTSGAGSKLAVSVTIAVAVPVGVALALVKPHALAAAALVPLIIPGIVPVEHRGRAMAAAVIATVAAIAVLVGPELWLTARFDPTGRIFGPRTLFCNSADLVYGDLSRRADPLSQAVSGALGRMLKPAARAAASDWPLLGFDGDQCTYGEPARIVAAAFANHPSDEASFYVRTYVRALAAHPGYLAMRFARHAWTLAKKPFNAVTTDYFFTADPQIVQSGLGDAIIQRWYATQADAFSGVVQAPIRTFRPVLRVFFVLMGAALVLGTVLNSLALLRWPDSSATTWWSLIVLAFSINAVIVVAHTYEPRYLAMQTPLFAVIGCAGTLALLNRWAAWTARS